MTHIIFTKRQEKILQLVQDKAPITGEEIATFLNVTRATLRPDLALLTRTGILQAKPRVGYYYNGLNSTDEFVQHLNKMVIKDWMGIPIMIDGSLPVYDAIVEIFMRDVGSLFISGPEGTLAGVISRKDLLRATVGQMDIHQLPVSMIMTRMPNVVTVTENDTLISACQKLQDHQIDSLPVVVTTPNGVKPVGRVTKTTIVKAFVSLGS